jgi:nanoRNase/pAp phosphatase (c-di-AMP/oligoRNAs hydrolase)
MAARGGGGDDRAAGAGIRELKIKNEKLKSKDEKRKRWVAWSGEDRP